MTMCLGLLNSRQCSAANIRLTLVLAVSAFCYAVVTPASALVITDVGTAGAPGANGLIGQRGDGGGGAQAVVASSDFTNIATATGGNGGQGGSSLLPLVPGARGGDGGVAVADVTSGGLYEYADDLISTARASGGQGGAGGGTVIRGNGGRGGDAQAHLTDSSGSENSIYSFAGVSTALGGAGGEGLKGGAGGAGQAVIEATNGNIFNNTTSADARGGNGGLGLLQGGNGGAARAENTHHTGGQPSESAAKVEATGGDGGSAPSGLNGNGGDAHAEVSGSFQARAVSMNVAAIAQGGDSGTGSLLGFSKGAGGDAVAISDATSYFPGTSAQSTAVGGAGLVRGGDAVAVARNHSALPGGASALAQGGAGHDAGAAVATAVASTDWVGATSNVQATYAGPFARSVSVVAGNTEYPGGSELTYVTQARAGDTRGLSSRVPAYDAAATYARGSIAASRQEVAAELAGSDAIATAFAGDVWGSGEAHAENTGPNSLILSYQFEVADYANPQHLWLGLLDADFSAETFLIQGEGVTLFDSANYADLFDDQLFDLGSWANLVGSDGLFDLDFRFANFSGDAHFVFANFGDGATVVSEPRPLGLLLPALGLLAWRRLRTARSSPNPHPSNRRTGYPTSATSLI